MREPDKKPAWDEVEEIGAFQAEPTLRDKENLTRVGVFHLAPRGISTDVDILGRLGRTKDVTRLAGDGLGRRKILFDRGGPRTCFRFGTWCQRRDRCLRLDPRLWGRRGARHMMGSILGRSRSRSWMRRWTPLGRTHFRVSGGDCGAGGNCGRRLVRTMKKTKRRGDYMIGPDGSVMRHATAAQTKRAANKKACDKPHRAVYTMFGQGSNSAHLCLRQLHDIRHEPVDPLQARRPRAHESINIWLNKFMEMPAALVQFGRESLI